ncbi:MAG: SH3 domain-containing protein [Lachnospiraceae bacterium]|nr:SH3 domain-containing protein [Lachnospiraceae bacterium]
MGKRRNKKQGNRQNTGNRVTEEKRIAEVKTAEESGTEEEQQPFSEEIISETEEQNTALYVDEAEPYKEEDDEAEALYTEEAGERMADPYADEVHEQNVETYMGDVDPEFSDVPIDSLLEKVDVPESEKKDSLRRQNLETTNDFADFTWDFFRQIGKWIKRNRRMAVISLAVCAGVVILIWIVGSISRSIDASRLAASVSDNWQSNLTVDTGVIPIPQEMLQVNAYPAVNELVTRYFEAMQNADIETLRTLKNYVDAVEVAKVNAKSQYVESYDNITCYTKVGPIANSYIVYVCYDVKFCDWDMVAPSLLTLFVCTNNEGKLYIYVGELDENIGNYIASITSQEDVQDLYQRVQTEYKEMVDANPEFANYMSSLNQLIRDKVGEQLADTDYLGDDTNNPTEGVQVVDVDVTDHADEENTGDFEVRATTTVNVRASDSEVADRLGKVEAGTTLICQEHQVNGWSRIIYENQIGYIKTEYLQTVGEGVDESAATGTITVSETVNVRRTANIAGEQMGVAYAGESFPLIGSTDGEWTQIIYNGQAGYIKSEFILGR